MINHPQCLSFSSFAGVELHCPDAFPTIGDIIKLLILLPLALCYRFALCYSGNTMDDQGIQASQYHHISQIQQNTFQNHELCYVCILFSMDIFQTLNQKTMHLLPVPLLISHPQRDGGRPGNGWGVYFHSLFGTASVFPGSCLNLQGS